MKNNKLCINRVNNIRHIGILFLFILFLGCNEAKFPSKITSKLTENHFRIKGTKLYVKNIDGFARFDGINGFRHSDSVVIYCFYGDCDFERAYANQRFTFAYNTDYQIVYHKTLTINGYNAVFYKLKEGNLYYLYFMFGDDFVENRIVAIFPIDKPELEKPIYDFMKSAYYDKDFYLDPMEDVKFEFDALNSGFKFSTFSMNEYVFIQMPKDTSQKANFLIFSQFLPTNDPNILKNTLDNVIEYKKRRGIIIENINFNHTYISGVDLGYEVVLTGKFENQKMYSRTIVSSLGLLYSTELYNNIEENIPLTDSIFKTVKLKTDF